MLDKAKPCPSWPQLYHRTPAHQSQPKLFRNHTIHSLNMPHMYPSVTANSLRQVNHTQVRQQPVRVGLLVGDGAGGQLEELHIAVGLLLVAGAGQPILLRQGMHLQQHLCSQEEARTRRQSWTSS